MQGHFAHGGDERLLEEVHSEWVGRYLWEPDT